MVSCKQQARRRGSLLSTKLPRDKRGKGVRERESPAWFPHAGLRPRSRKFDRVGKGQARNAESLLPGRALRRRAVLCAEAGEVWCTQDLKDVTNFNEAKGNPGQCWMLYCGLFFSRYSLFHCFKLTGAGSPGGDVTA